MKVEAEELVRWDKLEVLQEFNFNDLCAERVKLHKQVEEAEARLKLVNADISTALQICGQKAVQWNNWRVFQICGRTAARLSPKALIELGVDPAIIAEATEPGREYATVSMKEIKPNESGN